MIWKALPGKPYPLGATWDGNGVNFAVYSEQAEKVELCLFGASAGQDGAEERIPVREVTGHVWHIYLPGAAPGQLYAYRIYGPYRPNDGLRFNPAKVLIDPYARAIAGKVNWEYPVFEYVPGHKDGDLLEDEQDDAGGMPKCVVIDPAFNWGDDSPPDIPWQKTIIYETHVRGCTMRHPGISPKQRGTYSGLACKTMLEYFKSLGITSIELMPVHDFTEEKGLVGRGLANYWGYNTTNFFSPSSRYSSSGDTGGQVAEFKRMVKTLHREGIEVILDVVYNHTSEGNHLGPTLSFRGVDNPTYYRLAPGESRFYVDYTGTGNSMNVRHPQVLELIMDSLRYWVTEMHVDGFRFDLASALARQLHEVDRLSAFFDVIHQDPVISRVKLIAEPWDVGEGGYQVGNFPALWTEWNGKYRNNVRQYWRGDEGQIAELAYRLAGSSDLYNKDGRQPYASINYVTSHDGFTLNDLVSYERRHNEANGLDNEDGMDENYSSNCGVEGPTEDQIVNALREQQKRNLLATLLLSQGVPMVCGGDELGRTQKGNNNAYCLDNETSWYNWQLDDKQQDLLNFTRYLCSLRADHPVLRRREFFQGRPIRGLEVRDIMWLRPDGHEMADKDWATPWVRCIGVLLDGDDLDEYDDDGNLIKDDTFLMVLNSYRDSVNFLLPAYQDHIKWEVMINTASPYSAMQKPVLKGGASLPIPARSLFLLKRA
jgi:isoamylase